MEQREEPGKPHSTGEVFFIEAAIDERGPQELKVVPSYHQYLIYNESNMCACIQRNDDGDWDLVEGDLSPGVIRFIGEAIIRARG